MTPKEWAIAHIGDGYIYGARGQKCSLAFRQQQAQQYPAQADMILGTGAKWDGHIVWDCAQFTRAAWKESGVILVSGATSQWNKTDWKEKGTIDEMPKDKVCSVFRQSGSTMQHTGLYIGEGIVIHAKGTKNGVIKDTLTNYPWTHFGIPKSEEKHMDVLFRAIVSANSGKTVRMRASASREAQVIAQVPIGTEVDVYEEKPEWYLITYNGKSGYMMAKFLVNGQQKPEDPKQDPGLYLYEKAVEHDNKIAQLMERVAALEALLGEG